MHVLPLLCLAGLTVTGETFIKPLLAYSMHVPAKLCRQPLFCKLRTGPICDLELECFHHYVKQIATARTQSQLCHALLWFENRQLVGATGWSTSNLSANVVLNVVQLKQGLLRQLLFTMPLTPITCLFGQVVMFDIQQRSTLGELSTPFIKYVVWSADMNHVALLSKHAIIIANKKLGNASTGQLLTLVPCRTIAAAICCGDVARA